MTHVNQTAHGHKPALISRHMTHIYDVIWLKSPDTTPLPDCISLVELWSKLMAVPSLAISIYNALPPTPSHLSMLFPHFSCSRLNNSHLESPSFHLHLWWCSIMFITVEQDSTLAYQTAAWYSSEWINIPDLLLLVSIQGFCLTNLSH